MHDNELFQPLKREDVIKAIERGKPPRIPLVKAKWWGDDLENHYGSMLNDMDKYPEDVVWLWIENPAQPEKMNLSWKWNSGTGHDARCVIDEWSKLDEFIGKLPSPEKDPQFDPLLKIAESGREEERYLLFGWWRLFFEMPWGLRGMENLMVDYYLEPDNVHRLHTGLCDTYMKYIEYARDTLCPDGFWTGDDLGQQTGPMMGPETFETLIFPYYERLGRSIKDKNMHFWLHSCGDNTLFLPYLIDAGLTVFHPVQKGTMNEVAISEKFGEKLTFLSGIDVQHTLQEKNEEGVREEVRFLIDTFDKPDGGMCIAAGNGIVPGIPIENIDAFLDESIRYGYKHREQYKQL